MRHFAGDAVLELLDHEPVTAAIVGSVTTALPPACTIVIVIVIVNGISYQQYGSTW